MLYGFPSNQPILRTPIKPYLLGCNQCSHTSILTVFRSRTEYRELLEWFLLVNPFSDFGGTFTVNKPGAYTEARWMRVGIYKLGMFWSKVILLGSKQKVRCIF